MSRRSPIPREEFHERLRAWHDDAADGETVRDADVVDEDSYDVDDWIWVKYMGNRYFLHAGSTREGVGRYLEHLDAQGEALPWPATPGGAVSMGGAPIEGFVLMRAP